MYPPAPVTKTLTELRNVVSPNNPVHYEDLRYFRMATSSPLILSQALVQSASQFSRR